MKPLENWVNETNATHEIGVPAKLAARAELSASDLPVTAELHDWVKVPVGNRVVIYGTISGDTRGAFYDGQSVRTSALVRIDGDLAITANSVYRLIGDEKPANSRPLF